MSTQKVTNLTELATAADDDVLLISDVSASASKKITVANLIDPKVAALVDSAPATLDTLNELAAALGDDPNFATTVATQIGTKLDSADYTAADVLTKIKTVDGSGSGLDADTLDGNQATAFATAAQGTNADTAYGWGDHASAGYMTPTYTGNVDVTGTVTADGLTVDGSAVTATINATSTNGGLAFTNGSTNTSVRDWDIRSNNTAFGDLVFRRESAYGSGIDTKSMSLSGNGDISFYEDTGTTAKFFWDASTEQLAIGHSTPGSRIHTEGSSANERVTIKNTLGTGGTSRLQLTNNSDTNSNGFQIINNGDDGVVNILNYKNTDMAFWTNTAERMRIDSSGNVGIGTSSPQTGLHVHKNWVLDYGSVNISADTNNLVGLGLRADNAYRGGLLYRDGTSGGYLELTCFANQPILFKTGTSGTERMRIDSSGNLLVGTTSASEKLTVNGGIQATYGRSTLVTDNDGSFDLNAGQNFKCTPTGNITLDFTNVPNGQSGFVILDNSGGHTISADATTYRTSDILTQVTAAGVYLISYLTDGTSVYITGSTALANS